jgi:hypothetical protein
VRHLVRREAISCHLATALVVRERMRRDLVLATHDAALAHAARAVGMAVVGS